MPYIDTKTRRMLHETLRPSTVGELNYVLTKICIEYLSSKKEVHYADLNDIIGVLECCKQEFYRRVVVPYEDAKISENGDVY